MQVVTYATRRLVRRHRGTMPIILTSPHGGNQQPPRVSERTAAATPSTCTGANGFNTSRDFGTAEITEAIALAILEKTGLSPYVVIARFDRKYIDANRREDCAFTDNDARPFYREYHARIDGYIDQILRQNGGRGFLFDIHGTGLTEADIFLGSNNGGTLLPGFDRNEMFAQYGIHGLLEWSRYPAISSGSSFRFRVSPPNSRVAEVGAVNGGFTVRNYGTRINAIQIELAQIVRNNAQIRGYMIDAVANAIVNSVRRHAPF